MRKYLLSFCMIMAVTFVVAQGQRGPSASYVFPQEQKSTSASFAMIDNQPAVMVVLPYAPATVLSAMMEYELNCFKSKKKQSTAYTAFDNTSIIKNNKKDASLIFRVGPKDVQQQDQTMVYLLLNAPIDKGEYAGTINRFEPNDAIAYLDNLAVAVQVINLDNQIKTYTTNLRKEERLQGRYAKRCDRLESKKTAIQDKLAQNKRSVANRERRLGLRLTENQNVLALHKATVEKHRTDLTQLTNQRKSFKNK